MILILIRWWRTRCKSNKPSSADYPTAYGAQMYLTRLDIDFEPCPKCGRRECRWAVRRAVPLSVSAERRRQLERLRRLSESSPGPIMRGGLHLPIPPLPPEPSSPGAAEGAYHPVAMSAGIRQCPAPRCRQVLQPRAVFCPRCGARADAAVVDPRTLSATEKLTLAFKLAGGDRDVVAEPPIEQVAPWKMGGV